MKIPHKSAFESQTFATDRFIPDYGNRSHFNGIFDNAVKFICDAQLRDRSLYRRFAAVFGTEADDSNRGWRCEYWGKLMRGACFICAYTQDSELYSILEEGVRELLARQDADGRITTYSRECEFSGWDMWGRKYVLLGLQYFSEICSDEALLADIRTAMCRHADHIMAHVGRYGIPINETSGHWMGINSMSILEPFVRLYNLTGEQKYLDYAAYIVDIGENGEAPIFRLAAEDRLDPCQYPITKAYEMMSCFEGLIEYYRVTGEDKYRRAALNFGRRVLESDYTVIGCSGCTHELFDGSTRAQTDDDFVGIMQETCVSVTLMKLMAQLLRLSGDADFADAIERTFFNAYLGSLNTHRIPSVVPGNDRHPELRGFLPFDSYSPLRAGTRGQKIGGLMRVTDSEGSYFYGCCACIGAAGAGIIPRTAVMRTQDGAALTFWLPGYAECTTPTGKYMRFEITGDYPVGGSVRICVRLNAPERMTLSVRVPAWSRQTSVTVNGSAVAAAPGYLEINRLWQDNDTISLELDTATYAVLPPDPEARGKYIALRRGCIVLAADARLGFDPDRAEVFPVDPDGRVRTVPADHAEIPDLNICVSAETADGSIRLIDYASAGKTYDAGSLFAAWIRGRAQSADRHDEQK